MMTKRKITKYLNRHVIITFKKDNKAFFDFLFEHTYRGYLHKRTYLTNYKDYHTEFVLDSDNGRIIEIHLKQIDKIKMIK